MISRGRRIGLPLLYDKPAYGTAILNPYHPFSQGLVGQWLANEGAGNIAYDTSGQGNHGTLTNGAYWAGSQLGEGINFDGVNDWVSLPLSIPGDYLSWNMNYSVETWIQINNTSTEQNVLVYSGGSTNRAGITIRGGTIGAGTYNGADEVFISGDAITTGLHHVIVTNTSANVMAMYIDGVSQSGVTQNSWESDNVCGIGFTTSPFNGANALLRFYTRVLSPMEAAQHCHDPFCNMMRLPLRRYSAGGTSPTTEINKQISLGTDDCYELDDTTAGLTNTTIFCGYTSGAYDLGARWQSLNIPQGATITSAKLSLYLVGGSGTLSANIRGIDEDNTLTWATNDRPSQRVKTTATINANQANWNNWGTPAWIDIDITSVVQEIINRSGWSANNDLAVVIEDTTGSGTNFIQVDAYEYSGNVSGAKLDIVYQGTPPPTGAIMNQFQSYNIGADLYNGGIIV